MKAMILAAGRGERMRPLTDQTPKPLLKVGPYSLIEHQLLALKKAGIDEVIINISHHAKMIMKQLGDGHQYGLTILYSYEENEPLGTGGGIYRALNLLGDASFLLISGDIWTDLNFKRLIHHSIKSEAHLVMVDNPDYHPKGDFCLLNDGHLRLCEPRLTYASIALIHPQLMKDEKPGQYPLAPILKKAINRGAVTGERFAGQWYNVGTPVQLEMLTQRLNELTS